MNDIDKSYIAGLVDEELALREGYHLAMQNLNAGRAGI